MKTCVTWRSKPNGRRTSTCGRARPDRGLANRPQQTAAMGRLRGYRLSRAYFHGTVLIAVHSAIQGRNRPASVAISAAIGGTDGQRRDHDGPDRRIRRRFLISRPRIRSRHVRGTPIAPVRAGAHNMAALGLTQAQVVCGDGVEYLRAMEPAQLIYIDPARRDEHAPAPTRSRTARPTCWRCAICCWLRRDM